MQNLKETLFALETSLLQPEVRSSVERLDALLADDFKEFGSSGLVYTKENILERLPQNKDEVRYVVSDFAVQQLSETIVMVNFKTEKVVQGGAPSNSLRTSLWRNEGGVWKIFFHQGTPLQA